jgi:hypothetical protein
MTRRRVLIENLLGRPISTSKLRFILIGVVQKKIRTSEKSVMISVPSKDEAHPPLE